MRGHDTAAMEADDGAIEAFKPFGGRGRGLASAFPVDPKRRGRPKVLRGDEPDG